MGNRRLALLVGASLCYSHLVLAQPAEGEIEMEGDTPADPQPDQQPTDQPTDEPADQPADQPTDQAAEPAKPEVVKDPKVAKKWQRAGDILIRKGDYLTRKGKTDDATQQYNLAVTAYQHAVEASDDVTMNYYLAVAEDKAGLATDAMKHVKLALAAEGIKPYLQKKAQTLLDELSMKIGIVKLNIKPDGTQVMIEGKEIGVSPLTESLVLMPGTHMVSLSAVGFQPKELELKVEAGSESERTIELDPVPVVVQAPTVEEPETPFVEPPKGPSKLPLYIGGGATIGLAVAATVTGIMAVGKHGTYTDPASTPSERADAQSSGKTLAHVTDICIIGAVGAAAFTAYWYQFKYRPQARAATEHEAQAKVDVVPWVQPQAGGLTVAGSF
jgi:hypothetical protein